MVCTRPWDKFMPLINKCFPGIVELVSQQDFSKKVNIENEHLLPIEASITIMKQGDDSVIVYEKAVDIDDYSDSLSKLSTGGSHHNMNASIPQFELIVGSDDNPETHFVVAIRDREGETFMLCEPLETSLRFKSLEAWLIEVIALDSC